VEKYRITLLKREKKKGQATHITPLNLLPLLASAPGGLKGAGCMRLTPHKSRNFIRSTKNKYERDEDYSHFLKSFLLKIINCMNS